MGFTLAVLLPVLAFEPFSEPTLGWLDSARSDRYSAPQDQQLALAEQLWRQLIRDQKFDQIQRRAWASLGFEARRFGQIVAFREHSDQRRGWGAFAIRLDSARPLLIQAPHRYYDRGTGKIAWVGWQQTRALGLALNSAPRAQVDLAHEKRSMLLAFTRAMWAERPALTVVQVHGFAASKRRTSSAKKSELVLSAGHVNPRALHRDRTACLREKRFKAALFPRDVRELGGTRNAIARSLRLDGFDRFFHLELSAELRSQLFADDDRMKELWRCL